MFKKGIALLLTLALCVGPLTSLAASIWICPTCGNLNNDQFCPKDGTPKPESRSGGSNSSLSPNNKCPVRPTFYRNLRYRDAGSNTQADYRPGLAVRKIIDDMGRREYGIFLKFTPSRRDSGYEIRRFDVVITGPSGRQLYTEGFNTNMTCQYGYYWAWEFYSLDDFFRQQVSETGTIASGKYLMDIYFNSLWAGQIWFKIAP